MIEYFSKIISNVIPKYGSKVEISEREKILNFKSHVIGNRYLKNYNRYLISRDNPASDLMHCMLVSLDQEWFFFLVNCRTMDSLDQYWC